MGGKKQKRRAMILSRELFRELYETEESIAGIGMRVGYSNPGKFSAAFQSGDEPYPIGLPENDHILSINCLDKKTIFRYDFG